LSSYNYRLFFSGQLIKLIGVWTQIIAQDWLVLQLTDDSATALGFVTALQFLPIPLLTLYVGTLADRHDKRKLLIWANGVFAVAAALLGLLVASGNVSLWHVFAFAGVTGVVNAVENPVRQAFVSELVRGELLPNALALMAVTFNTARIIGPAVAGVAVGWIGVGPVFVVDAVLCAIPLLTLAKMRPAELAGSGKITRSTPEEPGVVSAPAPVKMIDGLRYVWRRADLMIPILLVLVIGMFGFNFQLTLAVLAKTEFNTGARTFGLLTTALAVGALAGAFASTARKERPSLQLVVMAAVCFGALEITVGLAPGFLVAAMLLIPTGFFMVFFAQAANQRVQLGTDAAYRGRVMALYVLVFLGTTPVGAPLVGWCAERFGPRSGIWVGGLVSLVATVVIAVAHARRIGATVRVRLRERPHLIIRGIGTDQPREVTG
jgi:MFS family permease